MNEARVVRLNILEQSPHDQNPCAQEAESAGPRREEWVPSYYNVRATAEDGSLVLWNSLRGAMSVFKPEQAPRLVELLRKEGLVTQEEGIVKYLVERGFLV